jgi:hypothetical protein
MGPEVEVRAFKERAVGHSPWLKPEQIPNEEPAVLNFHNLIPIPEEVLAAGYRAAGYDWERQNWGCKWGGQHSIILDEWEGHIDYQFDTAWSPPIEFLTTVAKKWPQLLFILDYEEPGVGFKGIAKFQGTVCEVHCLSL